MGALRAYLRALREKVLRDPLPPESVAAGWALGMFVGCAVPFGLQLLVSVPLAILLRVSKIGATLGTFVTNPVTILFIYPMQTWTAYRILFGRRGMGALPEEWTLESVSRLSGPVIASFFIGGLALALVLSPVTYRVVLGIVKAYRARRKGV